jgi:oligoribonuclease
LDLETTGLEPAKEQILEVYLREADLLDPFNTRELYHAVLNFSEEDARVLLAENAYVHAMHTKNGLLVECAHSTKLIEHAERELLELIPEESARENMPAVAGSSVHFDLNFLREHAPKLAARFSHRVFDVSAVMLFARSMGSEKFPRAEAHRAKDDVLESIENGRKCREFFLRSRNFSVPADPFAELANRAGIVDVEKDTYRIAAPLGGLPGKP